ncbi:MAG: type II secretion system F family protein [Candidatus Aenigmarchaeota archaeon]|nr:type II secretion system F family protein [Candidatus Aenigmarchaeota archaeon]
MKKIKDWEKIDYIKFVPPMIGVLTIMVVAVVFLGDVGILGVTILFSIIISAIPYFIFSYIRHREVSAMEEQLPNFLRDLVEEARSGMTLSKSIQMCSRVDYGRLSKEVKKMYYQLTWGVPLEDVLIMFSKRIKESKLIKRSIDVLVESHRSGGEIISTMESVAMDSALVKSAEKERKSNMAHHTMSLYLIYFMFIGVLLALTNVLTSMMGTMATGFSGEVLGGGIGIEMAGPCSGTTKGVTGSICSFFSGPCKIFDFGTGSDCYYKSMFLYMILIQGMCSGLVAGQAGSESISEGFKHGLIMMGMGLPIFLIALRLIT